MDNNQVRIQYMIHWKVFISPSASTWYIDLGKYGVIPSKGMCSLEANREMIISSGPRSISEENLQKDMKQALFGYSFWTSLCKGHLASKAKVFLPYKAVQQSQPKVPPTLENKRTINTSLGITMQLYSSKALKNKQTNKNQAVSHAY